MCSCFPPRIIIDRWPFYAMKDMACCLFMLFLLIQPGGAQVDCHHLRPSFCGPMTLIAYLPSTFEFSPSYARLASPWFRADWFSHSKARGSSVSCMRWQDFQAQAVSPTCFVRLRRVSNVNHVMFDWDLGRCRRRKRRRKGKTDRRRLADDSEKKLRSLMKAGTCMFTCTRALSWWWSKWFLCRAREPLGTFLLLSSKLLAFSF